MHVMHQIMQAFDLSTYSQGHIKEFVAPSYGYQKQWPLLLSALKLDHT